MRLDQQASPTSPESSRPLPLWRNRNYLLLWSGQAISSVGGEASQLAFPLLVLAVTHSPAQAGFAGALRALSYLFLGLPAGALVDRWDRKRVMIICDTGRALALGSIPLALALDHLTMAQIYLVSILEGTLYVFFGLAESAALPRVVAKSQLPAATAQNEVTGGLVTLTWTVARRNALRRGARAALPGGRRLLRRLGADPLVDSRALPGKAHIAHTKSARRDVGGHSLALARAGDTRARSAPRRRDLLLRWIDVAGGGDRPGMNTPPYAIGLIVGLSGLGGIAGALLGAQAQKRLRLGQIIVGTFWLFALLWPLYAIAPSALALGAILGAFWVVDETYDVAQISYRLTLIPDALRGRVNGAFRLILLQLRGAGYRADGAAPAAGWRHADDPGLRGRADRAGDRRDIQPRAAHGETHRGTIADWLCWLTQTGGVCSSAACHHGAEKHTPRPGAQMVEIQ